MTTQNVFISEEARVEFHTELRKTVIKEFLEYGELENTDLADLLSNVLLGMEVCFKSA